MRGMPNMCLGGDNWYPELPTIYPPLVIPAAHTRLAVPVSPLFHDQFEVDVLGLSGRHAWKGRGRLHGRVGLPRLLPRRTVAHGCAHAGKWLAEGIIECRLSVVVHVLFLSFALCLAWRCRSLYTAQALWQHGSRRPPHQALTHEVRNDCGWGKFPARASYQSPVIPFEPSMISALQK